MQKNVNEGDENSTQPIEKISDILKGKPGPPGPAGSPGQPVSFKHYKSN